MNCKCKGGAWRGCHLDPKCPLSMQGILNGALNHLFRSNVAAPKKAA